MDRFWLTGLFEPRKPDLKGIPVWVKTGDPNK